jgi:hypothetical protein
MAVRWAVVNGNWSDTATWDGGTLPTVDDDVYADGKTVTIDQDVTVLSIRNNQRSGGTNGGNFIPNSGITINADLIRGSITLMDYSQSGTLNINGNLNTIADGGNQYVLIHSGIGIINLVGNISINNANSRNVILINSSGVVNFTGLINFGSNLSSKGIVISSNGILNFVGSFSIPSTGSTNSSQVGIENSALGTVNLYGIASSTNGIAAAAILNSGYLYVEGLIQGYYSVTSRPAIQDSGTTAINIIRGSIICSPYGDFPILVRRMNYVPYPNTSIQFATNSTNGQLPPAEPPTTFTLYSADVVIDAPVASDVRKDVVYADGVLTGTLAVPDPQDVRRSIPTDNTVGTADLTAEDLWTYATRTITNPPVVPTAQQVADKVWLDQPNRLTIVSTVDTTAAQLQAYLDQ